MKKNILLCAAVFFSIVSQAQSVKYGLTVGGNITGINGNGVRNSYFPGFIAGGFTKVPLNKKWDVQPELLFNYAVAEKARNFLELYNFNGYSNSNTSIQLSYLSIPVLFEYNVNKLLAVDAGPQYSFLADDNENLIQNNKRAFKRNDVGVSAGAELNLTGVRFFANYVVGTTNINNIDGRYKWYNRQAFVGFNFNIL